MSLKPRNRLPLFFNVAYDGSKFSGWQIQKNGIGVCQKIQSIFRTILHDPLIRVYGASRTDRGVHALGQAACALLAPDMLQELGSSHASAGKILYALNVMLRPEIKIQKIALPPENFQVRFDSNGKSYIYFLYHDHSGAPFFPWAWAVGRNLDLPKLKSALGVLRGIHDFRAFAKKVSVENKDCTRMIYPVKVMVKGKLVCIFFRGSGFLHHQVRSMVGTAVQLAKRSDLDARQAAQSMLQILAKRDRDLAGKTAPASGLFLHRVHYPAAILRQFQIIAR